MKYKLNRILTKYSEKNTNNYEPVAVGRYGIRKRSDIYKKELSNDYLKNKVIFQNVLIIGMGSVQIDVGVLKENLYYSVSPAYHTFKINTSIVLSEYLELLFLAKNSYYTKLYMIASARQGKKVDVEGLLNEIVEIPNLIKQQEIIDKINKINKLTRNYENQLQLLDEIIKSRFVEMFGDPILNQKGWKTEKLQNVCQVNKYKGEVENTNGKVWLLNLDMVESNTGKIVNYVYEDENNIASSTIKFDTNCVLYSKLRPYLNKVVVPLKSGYATSEMISMKTDNVSKYFLSNLLRMNSFVDFANGTSYGAKMPRASVDMIKNFDLIVPPINIQNEFSLFVEQVDKLKFIVEEQLKLMNELLNKKMDEYFN